MKFTAAAGKTSITAAGCIVWFYFDEALNMNSAIRYGLIEFALNRGNVIRQRFPG